MKVLFLYCKDRPLIGFGYFFVFFLIFLAIFADLIAPWPPQTANPDDYLQAPSWRHLFGTDETGMDIFSRCIYSIRLDLSIAFLGTAVSAIVGTAIGAFVGYYEARGRLKTVFSSFTMRALDVIQSFPVFVFAIALVAIFGQGLYSIIAAIAFVNMPIYVRLMRTQALSIRQMRYVEAAYLSGLSDVNLIIKHIVPNSMGPILSHLSVNVGWSVLLAAALSFAGAGVEAPTPEWGSMIAVGFKNIVTGQWWPSTFPGIVLGLTVFSFALIGASVEVLADPVRRRAAIAKY
ncbi:MAG: peptide ABC transporter permease [Rhodospirillaceae bacterium]|nr:peptide ABC transporter permease [Rhodospirillaceae bacterium]|tara:strand:- start:639 stop:1508 length:870 start_codon:yes stop_codon:yes gene_type:complete